MQSDYGGKIRTHNRSIGTFLQWVVIPGSRDEPPGIYAVVEMCAGSVVLEQYVDVQFITPHIQESIQQGGSDA